MVYSLDIRGTYKLTGLEKHSCSKLLVLIFFMSSSLLLSNLNFCAASSTSVDLLFGGDLDETVAGIIQTDDDGYVIAGTTYSFGEGDGDFWLIKLDPKGIMKWNFTYGGPKEDNAKSIIQTNDEGFAIVGKTDSFGTGNSNYWLVKVDSNGNMQWNHTYGQTISEANSVIQTDDNGYLLVGFEIDDSNSSVLIIKTDPFGNMQWNRTYEDNIYSKNVYSVVQSSDGGYLFAGAINAYSQDISSDGWIVKINSEGIIQWNQTYDLEGGFEYVNSLIQMNNGGYTFSGTTGGFFLRDVWIVNTDKDGNIIWDTVWDTAEPAYTNGVIQTNDGGYIVTGATDSRDGYFSSYMYMVKLDSNGNIQWNSTYSGLGDNKALFAIQMKDDNYALAGTTQLKNEEAKYDIWFAIANPSGKQIPEFKPWSILELGILSVIIVSISFRYQINKEKKKSKVY